MGSKSAGGEPPSSIPRGVIGGVIAAVVVVSSLILDPFGASSAPLAATARPPSRLLRPQGVEHQKDGFVIRRNAIETGVNVLTSLDTAEALVTSLENTDLHNLTLIDIATIASR